MPTIKDVARVAGVSISTVSRVMNGNYPVSEEAEKQVRDAINSLHYSVNAAAKSLKTNTTNIIALVTPEMSTNYISEIYFGIQEMISDYEHSLFVCPTDADSDKELKVLKELNEMRVTAVVLLSTFSDGSLLNEYIAKGLKVIVIDSEIPNLETVFVVEDNEDASFRLLDRALTLGHKKVGIIKGYPGIYTSEKRFAGYSKALKAHHILSNPEYEVEGMFSKGIAHLNVKEMIRRNLKNLPTLLFASSNMLAEGALVALRELEIRVPEDISLVSYGNVTTPRLIEPKLTCVEHNAEGIGRKVGSILVDLLNEPKAELGRKTHTISTTINEGASIKLLTGL